MGKEGRYLDPWDEGIETSPYLDFAKSIQHEGLRQLAQAWVDIFLNQGGIPTRSHLDPMDFPKALARVWYLHFDKKDEEFKFILVGDEIAEAMGQYPKNKPLTEVYAGEDYKLIRSFLWDSLTRPMALYGAGLFRLASIDGARFERLCLPISSTGREIDRVIGGTAFTAPISGAQSLLEEDMEKRMKLDLKGYGVAVPKFDGISVAMQGD